MRHPATIAAILVTGLACAALVLLHLAALPGPAAVAKVIASSGYLATAISVGAPRHTIGRIILAGLLLSMCGDLFLIGQARREFLFGLVSFLLAHIAYTTAFIGYGQQRRWTLTAAIPAIAVAVLVLRWLTPELSSQLVVPVQIYTAAITIMLITAFGARGAGASTLLVAGAMMFFVSDLSVAMQRLLGTDFPTIVWGLPLYYSGQTCIALGAAFSLRDAR